MLKVIQVRLCLMSGVRMAKVEVEAVGDRVTIQTAARRLGVKDDAVRKRIQRGTLDYEKDPDGRVYVFLDAAQSASQDNNRHSTGTVSQDSAEDTSWNVSQDILLNTLQDQIQYLRNIIEARDRGLESRTEELRRKDTIIMSLAQRVPELSPTSSPEGLGTTDGLLRSPKREEDEQPTKNSQLNMKRPWWRRIFGG